MRLSNNVSKARLSLLTSSPIPHTHTHTTYNPQPTILNSQFTTHSVTTTTNQNIYIYTMIKI
ncbi:hypothetical protein PP707_04640, partial [Acetobacter pasteurianus]|nr:hypothetical protein [Acetobacter pasteurianus]